MAIKKPARIESSSVYLKIVDCNGDLICFISNSLNNKEIAEELLHLINRDKKS